MNITKQLSEIDQSGAPYIIYKSQKGFDLYTNFSKKIILNNKNIKSFLSKINKKIAVEKIENKGIGLAINDRLRKASSKK